MKKNLSFSMQILVILISLCIICTSLTGFIGYNIAKKLNEDLVLDKLKIATDSTYNLIDSAVNTSIRNYLRAISEKNKNIVELYYEKYKKGEMTETQAKMELEKIILSQKVGDSGYIYVLDSKGILDIHPKLKNTNISNYDFVKAQIKDKQGYIEYKWKNPGEEEARDKVVYMTYFVPWDYIISVSSYKSEFLKLVNTSDFKKNIYSLVLGKTGYMYVIDSTGKLIIHPKQEGTNIYDSKDSHGNYFIREIVKNKDGRIVYPWKNPEESIARDKLVIYKYYEPMDWYLCSGVYIDELYEPIAFLRNALIVVFGFVMFLTIIISIVYGKIIVNPLKRLSDAASKIMVGNFDVKIFSKRTDEIGKLTDIFNSMVIKIKNSMENSRITNQKLEDMNINLEQKVVERTEQLISNNEILEKEIKGRKRTESILKIKYTELIGMKKKLQETNMQLESLSNLDPMTGIANRRCLERFLDKQWKAPISRETPLSAIMIDIDFFKKFNDTYGHLAGDECIRQVAKSLSNSVTNDKDFVARYGGEEFIAVLPNADKLYAYNLAQQIRKNIERLHIPHTTSGISEYVTVSIGVATIVQKNRYLQGDLIKTSDEALYKAKETGRNRVIVMEHGESIK